MKSILDWVRIVVAIVLLGVGMVVVWKYKWVLLGSVLVYVLIMMACNHYYRKATGKDMTIYTRIFKD
jgi:hypothetical protein